MEIRAALKKYRFLTMVAIGAATMVMDYIIEPGQYSKLSMIGVLFISFAFVDLGLRLANKSADPDVLFAKYLGVTIFFICLLNIAFMLLYGYIFKALMIDILLFSVGAMPLGVAMMVINPNKFSDDELEEMVAERQNTLHLMMAKASTGHKIIWSVSLIGGIAVTFYLYDHYRELILRALQ